jgi:hypothetical protein
MPPNGKNTARQNTRTDRKTPWEFEAMKRTIEKRIADDASSLGEKNEIYILPPCNTATEDSDKLRECRS